MARQQTILKEDLSIKCDITTQDLHAYAEQLGIDYKNEPHLLWIAREGLEAPVPAPWCPVEDGEGRIYYFNQETRHSSWDHPADSYYKKLVNLEKQRHKSSNAPSGSALHSSAAAPEQSELSSLEDIPPLPSANKIQEEAQIAAQVSLSRDDSTDHKGTSLLTKMNAIDLVEPESGTTMLVNETQKTAYPLPLRKEVSNNSALKKNKVLSSLLKDGIQEVQEPEFTKTVLAPSNTKNVKFELEEEEIIEDDIHFSSQESEAEVSEGLFAFKSNLIMDASLLGLSRPSRNSMQALDPLLHISGQSLSPPSEPLVLESENVMSPIKLKQETYDTEQNSKEHDSQKKLEKMGTLSDFSLSENKAKERSITKTTESLGLKEDISEANFEKILTNENGKFKDQIFPDGDNSKENQSEELQASIIKENIKKELSKDLEQQKGILALKYTETKKNIEESHLKEINEMKEKLQAEHDKELERMNEKLQAEHSKELAEIKEKLHAKLQQEIEEEKEKLISDHNKKMDEMETNLQVQHENKKQQMELNFQDKLIEDMAKMREEQKVKHSKEMDRLKQDLEKQHLEDKEELLQNLAFQLEQEMENLKEDMERDIVQKRKEIAEKKKQVISKLEEDLKNWYLNKEQEMEKQKAQIRRSPEFQDLQSELFKMQGEMIEKEQSLESFKEQIAILQGEKMHLESYLKELKDTIRGEEQRLQEVKARKASLSEQVEKLNEELASGKKNVIQLQDEIQILQEDFVHLEKQVKNVREKKSGHLPQNRSMDSLDNSLIESTKIHYDLNTKRHDLSPLLDNSSRDNNKNSRLSNDNQKHCGLDLIMQKIETLEKQFFVLESRLNTPLPNKEQDKKSEASDNIESHSKKTAPLCKLCRHHCSDGNGNVQEELDYYKQKILNLQARHQQLASHLPFGNPPYFHGEPAWLFPSHPLMQQPSLPHKPLWQHLLDSPFRTISLPSLNDQNSKNGASFTSAFEKKVDHYSSQVPYKEFNPQYSSGNYENPLGMSHSTSTNYNALEEWQQQMTALHHRMQEHHDFLRAHSPYRSPPLS